MAIALAAIVCLPAFAGDLDVSWNPSATATGYRLHFGTSPSQYDSTIDVGDATQTNLNTLGDCTMWYFAATAYNVAGESDYSTEVASWPRPILKSATPSAAEQGRQLDVSLSGTNFQSGAVVSFSDPAVTLNSVTVASCNALSFNITIGDSAAVGPVVVTVAHPNGVSGQSAVFAVEAAVPPTVSATTPSDGASGVAVDVSPTVSFSEPVSAATVTSSTVRLLDDADNPVAQAAGSPSLSPDSTTVTVTPASDLGQDRVYRLEVSGVVDLAGHAMAATYTQSTGFQTVADTNPPVIRGIATSAVGSTTATIDWNTDEAATSQVLYRKVGDTDYQQTAVDSALVTQHSVSLQGLAPNTAYEFDVHSVDAAGNAANDASGPTFTTAGNDHTYFRIEGESGDLTAPVGRVAGGGAFGDAWIEMVSGNGTPSDPNGIASYGANLPAGAEWFVWIRLYAPNPASDSWAFRIDTGTWSTLTASGTGEWIWHAAGSSVLTSGLHSVQLGGVDSGVRADRILLTDDPDFVPTEQPADDQTPPSSVNEFTAASGDGSTSLGWTNPSEPDVARIVIRYRTDGVYPQSAIDGFAVLDSAASSGAQDSHTHQGLANGVTYYYSAFAIDASGNVSSSARVEATPEAAPTPPAPPSGLQVF